jgi:hypothetical protein
MAKTGSATLIYPIPLIFPAGLDALARLWAPWPSQIGRWVAAGIAQEGQFYLYATSGDLW